MRLGGKIIRYAISLQVITHDQIRPIKAVNALEGLAFVWPVHWLNKQGFWTCTAHELQHTGLDYFFFEDLIGRFIHLQNQLSQTDQGQSLGSQLGLYNFPFTDNTHLDNLQF